MSKFRILALLLVFSMLVGMVPAFADNSVSYVDTKTYSEAQNALAKIGVLEQDNEIISLDTITRYDFVELLVNMYSIAGIELKESGKIFSDVPADSETAATLSKAASVGLIHGDASSGFRPDDAITEIEALTIALNALGYNQIKDQLVSHMNYISIAYKLELLNKNIKRDVFTKADAYLLLYNMLNTPVLQVVSIGSSDELTSVDYDVDDEVTLLYTLFGIKKEEGVMLANEVTNLVTGERLKPNNYQILNDDNNTVTFVAKDGDSYIDYIGMDIDVYYTDINDTKEIVFVFESNDNEYIDISGEDVIEYDYVKRRLEYYEDKDSSDFDSILEEESKEIPVSVNIVYNAYSVDNNKAVFDRINEAAQNKGRYNIRNIRLLDNDKDGVIDVMYVNMYVNYFVERVSSMGEIMDFFTKDVVVIKDVPEQLTYIKDPDGNKVEYSTIEINDVLCIERDFEEKNVITAIVVRNTSDSVIQSKKQRFGYSFTIDNQEIKLANAPKVKEVYDNATISNKYKIYYDVKGYIVKLGEVSENMQFGYVLDSDRTKGLSAKSQLKVCVPDTSETGTTITIYDVKDKLKIDGAVVNSEEYNFAGIEYKLIRFKANSGNEIIEIDTPSTERGVGEFSYAYDNKETPITGYWMSAYGGVFYEASGDIVKDGAGPRNLFLGTNAIVLAVPQDESVVDGENCIAKISPTNYFVAYSAYRLNGFVLDENDLTCCVVLVYFANDPTEAEISADKSRSPFVVGSVSKAINNNGKEATLIKGYEERRQLAYTSASAEFINSDTGEIMNIVPGDVLQVKVDFRGDAVSARKLYDFKTDSYGSEQVKHSKYGLSTRVAIGAPYSVTNGEYFTFVEKNDKWELASAEVFRPYGSFSGYVFDCETNELRLGGYKDMIVGKDQRVFIYAQTTASLMVTIYKNWKPPVQ